MAALTAATAGRSPRAPDVTNRVLQAIAIGVIVIVIVPWPWLAVALWCALVLSVPFAMACAWHNAMAAENDTRRNP
ncbi:hypothetical protein AD006_29405 (plasmid) [Pseudonocardia sp. EC080610-09]|nr:hypothetical protein AD006_29405 [Pseudonocardia sp. EC080610-09]ALL85651.1 hypothetical protein AD017_31845 [Pseudonocardia sp. EC080619-01]